MHSVTFVMDFEANIYDCSTTAPQDSKSARRKRRSFREIVTNSLTRKRSGIKNVYRSPSRKGKKDRALSEDAAATSSLAEEEEDEEEERSAVTRSVSLDPASVSVRLRTATMSSVLSSSPPAYQNESVFGTARPPKPPDRTASLPEPEIQPQQQQTRAGKGKAHVCIFIFVVPMKEK